jgi:hypothetical protein
MNNTQQKYNTRSIAQTQEFSTLTEAEHKSKRETRELQNEQHETKMIHREEEHGTGQNPNKMIRLLQQLLVKQDLMLEENKQLEQDMASQPMTINSLSDAVEAIQVGRMLHNMRPSLAVETNTASIVVKNDETKLEEQAAKQLQSKRIDQLINSAPFTGSIIQEISDWIEDFSNKCDQLRFDDTQRFSVATDLLKGNTKLWFDTHKDSIDNWLTLKTKMAAYFKIIIDTDLFQLEQKQCNWRRPSEESAIDYCHSILNLCSKVD